jgi:hypothetical protein
MEFQRVVHVGILSVESMLSYGTAIEARFGENVQGVFHTGVRAAGRRNHAASVTPSLSE